MSRWDKFQAEVDAAQSFVKLIEDAKSCHKLHERAGMQPPEPLKRFLGLDQAHGAAAKSRPAAHIPAPERVRPDGVPPNWVWVYVAECGPNTLIPAVLHSSNEPLSGKDVIEIVTTLVPKLASGSIYNASTRLQALKVIDRSRLEWRLVDSSKAGILDGDVVWGDPDSFQKDELAAHRREAIVHILSHFEAGLQVVQIVEQLKKCSWMHAPANKDLLKADVKVLDAQGKIRQRGNSHKWELMPESEKGGTESGLN